MKKGKLRLKMPSQPWIHDPRIIAKFTLASNSVSILISRFMIRIITIIEFQL